jgi:hypothetical protein
VVAIDGKTLRRSYDRQQRKAALHMVSAWATANHLVLGEVNVADKSNEITAVLELLRLLDLHGCIVTLDALGCQHDVASQIIAQHGDYVLAGYHAGVKATRAVCIVRCRTVVRPARIPL